MDKYQINQARIKKLNILNYKSGDIAYWMIRDQRVNDNWALIWGAHLALKYNVKLHVIFCLRPNFKFASQRIISFMLKGLEQVSKSLQTLNIDFHFLIGDPVIKVKDFIVKHKVGYLISDQFPIKPYTKWQQKVADSINIPFDIIDTHNIVPVWITSNKREYSARTIRPKINNKLDTFLTEFPTIKKLPQKTTRNKFFYKQALQQISITSKPNEVNWTRPGEEQALLTLNKFIKENLAKYSQHKNDPTKNVLSNLSPFLHFGQISAQRVVLEILKNNISKDDLSNFLDEIIVRKELSDNFCYFEQKYDRYESLPKWALETLDKHLGDQRVYIYKLKTLETAKTHDPLWNAAQMQMSKTGKMHGYMRMYWAKKILEWTTSYKIAIKYLIYLNDKYSLDGRDPNGFVGILWSVGGIHDRPWFERPIFGKIRYMNYNGALRKFDVRKYIKKWLN